MRRLLVRDGQIEGPDAPALSGDPVLDELWDNDRDDTYDAL